MSSYVENAEDGFRADFYRFLAACYYEPDPAFAEECMFSSMAGVASRIDARLQVGARDLGAAYDADSRQSLLVDYARLFLGPTEILASPYGSSWLTGEKTLMQESTVAILDLYRAGGFEMEEKFRELPDHIAAELEFLYLLIHREIAARREGDASAMEAAEALRSRLLGEHLGRWVGPFTATLRTEAHTSFYRALARLTEQAVAAEVARLP
jgi:putative dimethyl sulfoxide reductase chaperone